MKVMTRISLLVALACSSLAARAETKAPTPAAPKKDYDISLALLGDALVGSAAELSLVITPKPGWSLKLETPFSARLSASQELKLGKSEFVAKDFLDPKTPHKTLKTELTAAKSGEYEVSSQLSFFLCSDVVCERHNEEVKTKVAIKAAK